MRSQIAIDDLHRGTEAIDATKLFSLLLRSSMFPSVHCSSAHHNLQSVSLDLKRVST